MYVHKYSNVDSVLFKPPYNVMSPQSVHSRSQFVNVLEPIYDSYIVFSVPSAGHWPVTDPIIVHTLKHLDMAR